MKKDRKLSNNEDELQAIELSEQLISGNLSPGEIREILNEEECEFEEIDFSNELDVENESKLEINSDIESKSKLNAKSKNNPKIKSKLIYNILIFIFSAVIVVCLVVLGKYFYENYVSEKNFDDLRKLNTIDDSDKGIIIDDSGNFVAYESKEEFIDIDGKMILKDFEALYNKNNDIVGWLTIDGTNIDYPVMQTMDNEEYYIYRNYDKEPSDSGTLFVDTASDLTIPSDITMIYGHNMHTGTMFAKLLKYEEEDFYLKNKIITFNTIHGYGTYEVIAAFRTEIKEVDSVGFRYYSFNTVLTEGEFNNYIDNITALTPYETSSTAEYGDKLIVLSTCAYHSDNGRYVVVAKKITKED